MAETQIEAIEQKAVVQKELSCLKAQEQLALGGITSDAAKRFIESCPVCGGVDSDVAEVICRRASHQAWRTAILRNGSERRAIMADDDEKPEAELTDEQLDEDERALARVAHRPAWYRRRAVRHHLDGGYEPPAEERILPVSSDQYRCRTDG